MKLTTTRCTLSILSDDDFTEVANILTDESVRQFLGGPVAPDTVVAKLDAMRQSNDTHWIVRLQTNGNLVGLVSLTPHHDRNDTEISFQYLPKFHGQGLAFETITAVMANAFKVDDLPRLVAETQVANTPSRKLLERVGMSEIKRVERFDEQQVIYEIDSQTRR